MTPYKPYKRRRPRIGIMDLLVVLAGGLVMLMLVVGCAVHILL